MAFSCSVLSSAAISNTPEAPASLAARLRNDAAANGFGVTQNGPFDLTVDFGEQEMRVPVPTEYGLWGTRVSFRDTWVRGSTAYSITPAAGGGSRVTMSNNPIYYHPDIGVWLPGPYDVATGMDMLQGPAAQ